MTSTIAAPVLILRTKPFADGLHTLEAAQALRAHLPRPSDTHRRWLVAAAGADGAAVVVQFDQRVVVDAVAAFMAAVTEGPDAHPAAAL